MQPGSTLPGWAPWPDLAARSQQSAAETILQPHLRSVPLPKRNFGFEKRQKELNKQRKREEKQQRKLDRAATPDEERIEDPLALDTPTLEE